MYTDKDIGRVCSRDGSPIRDELGQRTVVYLRIRPCMSFNSHKETAGDRLPSLQSSKRGFSLGWSVLTINSAIVKRRKPNISSRTLHKKSSQNWMQTITDQLTLSGIQIIFVVGYGWSNVALTTNSAVSSSRYIICTWKRRTILQLVISSGEGIDLKSKSTPYCCTPLRSFPVPSEIACPVEHSNSCHRLSTVRHICRFLSSFLTHLLR